MTKRQESNLEKALRKKIIGLKGKILKTYSIRGDPLTLLSNTTIVRFPPVSGEIIGDDYRVGVDYILSNGGEVWERDIRESIDGNIRWFGDGIRVMGLYQFNDFIHKKKMESLCQIYNAMQQYITKKYD